MSDLITALQNYGIFGKIVDETRGPLLEIIEFEPSPGTKLKNILASLEDIRREIGASSLRAEPAENSNSILFEIPADSFETVDFKAILASSAFEKACSKYALPICLGVDIKGQPLFADLAKMPHLLIGGATGSGKSVGLNTFILSLVAAKKPSDVKFVMIDPKKIEFSVYNDQKYMYCPVVTESLEAVDTLAYLADEMDKRYEIFAESRVKNLSEYNENGDGHLPYIVCVIDEFSNLMAADKNVDKYVKRLAEKARAAGIHLMLATQRPSVDVVTGVLKANFPTRLAYKMASRVDSQTIIDTVGAENLIGRGDCLFLASDGALKRLHGAFLPDSEIEAMLKPFAAKVKPLNLPKKEMESEVAVKLSKVSKSRAVKEQDGWFKRCWNFWWKLGARERQRIIKILTVIGAWLLAQIESNTKKKRK